MIRNDGVEFPVKVHIYGSYDDDYEETVYAAEWLYSHTQHEDIKKLIIQFIASWMLFGEPEARIDYMIKDTLDYLEQAGYRIVTPEFIKLHEKELVNAEDVELEEANKLIVNCLDNEFLRARFGGMYDTSHSSKEMVFRVSSVGFNWFNIIWTFVYNHRNEIESVTVVRDSESTHDDYFYSHNGVELNMLPVNDFINLSGRPVIESVEESLLEMYPNMNRARINTKVEILKRRELEGLIYRG